MSKAEKKVDRESQIQAIEAKLKLMEKKRIDELEINKTVATEPPVISLYQFNKTQVIGATASRHKQVSVRKCDRHNKPYSKHKSRH